MKRETFLQPKKERPTPINTPTVTMDLKPGQNIIANGRLYSIQEITNNLSFGKSELVIRAVDAESMNQVSFPVIHALPWL